MSLIKNIFNQYLSNIFDKYIKKDSIKFIKVENFFNITENLKLFDFDKFIENEKFNLIENEKQFNSIDYVYPIFDKTQKHIFCRKCIMLKKYSKPIRINKRFNCIILNKCDCLICCFCINSRMECSCVSLICDFCMCKIECNCESSMCKFCVRKNKSKL